MRTVMLMLTNLTYIYCACAYNAPIATVVYSIALGAYMRHLDNRNWRI